MGRHLLGPTSSCKSVLLVDKCGSFTNNSYYNTYTNILHNAGDMNLYRLISPILYYRLKCKNLKMGILMGVDLGVTSHILSKGMQNLL